MRNSFKILSLLVVIIVLIILGSFFFANKTSAPTIMPIENLISSPVEVVTPMSVPSGDFSCQPNECEQKISDGINNVSYPSCNPLVQINNTGAKNKNACDYWRIQQAYFGTEDYVNLSELSKEQKQANGENIVDGFLGMNDDIQIHRKAAPVFLKAEAEFNKNMVQTEVVQLISLQVIPMVILFHSAAVLVKELFVGARKILMGFYSRDNTLLQAIISGE